MHRAAFSLLLDRNMLQCKGGPSVFIWRTQTELPNCTVSWLDCTAAFTLNLALCFHYSVSHSWSMSPLFSAVVVFAAAGIQKKPAAADVETGSLFGCRGGIQSCLTWTWIQRITHLDVNQCWVSSELQIWCESSFYYSIFNLCHLTFHLF